MSARVLLGFIFLATGVMRAQSPKPPPPIDTDRPDLTDGTGTLALGRVQFESGLTATTSRDGLSSWSAPELLLRFGVLSFAELRVSQTLRSVADGGGEHLTGFDDIQVGTKFRLADQGRLPSISAELFTTIPTGASAIGAGRALPGGALLLQQSTNGPWSAGVELEISRGTVAPLSGFASLSIQFQLNERVQLYGEYYAMQADLNVSTRQHYLDSGVMVLLTNDIQIDARVGVGLNHDADRSFVGIGFALRH